MVHARPIPKLSSISDASDQVFPARPLRIVHRRIRHTGYDRTRVRQSAATILSANQFPATMMSPNPPMKSRNIRASSRLTRGVAPLNSFQMKTPPNSGDHRSTLSECIGNGGPRFARGNVAERRAQTPDSSAQHTDQVSRQRSFEIGSVAYRSADKRPSHDQRIEKQVADQYAERKDENGRIGVSIPAAG